MKAVIITGISGAGKTRAADWFEDQGYYCIDNMPPQLVKNFLELTVADTNRIEKVAFVADVRGGKFFDELEECVDGLRKLEGVESKILFIEASDETIIRRYNETRRNHPLSGGKTTKEIIDDERRLLNGIRRKADYIIDTTGMKVAALNAEMSRIFLGEQSSSNFNINITSFGYKYGIPSESDIQIDVRFIQNPYYVKSLKKLTGNNKKVTNYVMKFEISKQFVSNFHALIESLIPGYISEGKYHLNIAFGCTGGHHRSVAIANKFAEIFKNEGYIVTITHRDIELVYRERI